MTQTHNLRVSARTARLTASDDEGEGGYRFGGIAVGENDILYTDDGTPVIFTPEVLAESAETQAGEPLSIDHPEDDTGNPVYPPPVDQTPGKVPKAGYVPGQGLGYEANTHDESIANGVKAGSYDVSVHPTFDLTDEQDPETGAYIPTNVEFLDLSVVSKGMSPSNTAEWGPNAALASWTRQADIGAEIEAQATPDEEPPNWFRSWAEKLGLTASADEDPEVDEQESDEPAESGTDETDNTDMTDEETEETAEEQPGEEEVDEVETKTTPETDTNTVEVDIGEHEDFDAFLDSKIEQQVSEATAKKDKAEMADEVIAASEDYDEDDRESLIASDFLDRIHDRETSTTGAHLPGSAGARSSVTASVNGDGEDLVDEYGTGMQE